MLQSPLALGVGTAAAEGRLWRLHVVRVIVVVRDAIAATGVVLTSNPKGNLIQLSYNGKEKEGSRTTRYLQASRQDVTYFS